MSNPPKLLDQVRSRARTKQMSLRTEQTYVAWIRQFILFHDKQHSSRMGKAEVESFLTHLAAGRNVAVSTQNQVLAAHRWYRSAMVVEILFWSGAVLFIVLGVAGLIFPAIPGPPLLWVGLLLAAWAEQFVHVGTGTLTVLFVLMLLAVALDFVAGALGARRFGASGWSVFGATVGAIVGIFFFPIGLIAGPFIGAVAGEMIAGKALDAAGRAGVGATIGLLVGTVAKVAIGILMIGIFVAVRVLPG